MQKWEYFSLKFGLMEVEWFDELEWAWEDKDAEKIDLDERLNELGKDGWELVSVTPNVFHDVTGETGKYGSMEGYGFVEKLVYIFKRPID